MFLHSHLTILSTSILYRFRLIICLCLGLFSALAHAAQENWILSGTVVADEYAQAMFVNENGDEVLLTLGDEIQDCQLMDVNRESAKLRCDDQNYSLLLRHSIGDLGYDTSHTPSAVKQKMVVLPKDELTDYLKQRQRVVSEIGFLPVLEGEKVVGFSVSKVRPNTVVSTLDLYNGDVIMSVNGVPASDTSQFMHTVSELAMSTQLTIEVNRNGQRHAYTYLFE